MGMPFLFAAGILIVRSYVFPCKIPDKSHDNATWYLTAHPLDAVPEGHAGIQQYKLKRFCW